MSSTVLDCRGLPCPQPVFKCKQRLDQGAADGLRVLVDNEPAKENVTRFLAAARASRSWPRPWRAGSPWT